MAGQHIAPPRGAALGSGASEQALDVASASLRAHHAEATILTDVLQRSTAAAVGAWLATAPTASEYRLRSTPGPVDAGRWRHAADADRLWHVERPVTHGLSDASVFAFARLRHMLAGSAFRLAMERVAGRSLAAAPSVRAWVIASSGSVRPTPLDPSAVAVRFELFLSEGWRAADGGELVLIDGHERVSRFPATFNTAVVWVPRDDVTMHVAPLNTLRVDRRCAVVVVFAPDGRRADGERG